MATLLAKVGNGLSRLGERLAGKPASSPPGVVVSGPSGDRLSQYRLREMLYDNDVYLPSFRGGQLENVMQGELGKSEAACRGMQIPGYVYPFARIVDAYQRLVPGIWGDGVKVASTVNGRDVDARIVDPELDPIGRVWRWSNLDTKKASLLYMGANFGTVGLRAVYEPADRPEDRRVSIHLIDPRTIVAFTENLRGNLTYLKLESIETDRDGTTHRIEEEMTETSFSRLRDGVEALTPQQRVNVMGRVPVKLIRHKVKTPGQQWGDHAYRGLERPAMGINWSIANLLRSADQYAFAQVFMAAEGDAPTRVVLGNNVVLYNKLSKEGPTPIVEMLVPDINFAGALSVIQECRQEVRDGYPELALTEQKLLANQSGESKRQAMLAVKSRLEIARPNYIGPLKAIIGLCNSYGVLNSLPGFDFGTGVGTVEAADKAYGNGAGPAAFDLELDSVIPETPDDRLVSVAAETARRMADIRDGSLLAKLGDQQAGLEMAVGEEEAAVILARKAGPGSIPTEPM